MFSSQRRVLLYLPHKAFEFPASGNVFQNRYQTTTVGVSTFDARFLTFGDPSTLTLGMAEDDDGGRGNIGELAHSSIRLPDGLEVTFRNIEDARILAMDIGGSLTKVVIGSGQSSQFGPGRAYEAMT